MKCLLVWALLAVAGARPHLRASHAINSRIIDGTPADITDFPSQASLRYLGTHTCGGVLLTNNRVMTTAHCVDGRTASSFGVYYGSSDRTSGGLLSSVSSYNMHPSYDPSSSGFPNDIATVVAPITYDGVVAVAAVLPTGANDFYGVMCTVTGWGRTDATDAYPDLLQQVSLPALRNIDCSTLMSGIATINDQHICVFDNADMSAGTCEGDNGGPMYCPEGETTVVAGIRSWGIVSSGTCLTDYPSVYTRVGDFIDWLPQL